MVVSKRVQNAKSAKYHSLVSKRGTVELAHKKQGLSVGPLVLGFFIFVVIGSALLQIISTATTGAPDI